MTLFAKAYIPQYTKHARPSTTDVFVSICTLGNSWTPWSHKHLPHEDPPRLTVIARRVTQRPALFEQRSSLRYSSKNQETNEESMNRPRFFSVCPHSAVTPAWIRVNGELLWCSHEGLGVASGVGFHLEAVALYFIVIFLVVVAVAVIIVIVHYLYSVHKVEHPARKVIDLCSEILYGSSSSSE